MTGVTNLSEGSIVYGNATEIVTELSAGSEGDALQISSGVPAWGSSATAAWEPKEAFVSSLSNDETFTFASAFDFASHQALRLDLFLYNGTAAIGTWDLDFTFNGTFPASVNNITSTQLTDTVSTVVNVTNDSSLPLIKSLDEDTTMTAQLFFYQNPHDNAMNVNTFTISCPEERIFKSGMFWAATSYTTITEFKITVSGGGSIGTGTNLQTYVLNYP